MNAYEQKREARVERMRSRSAKLAAEGESRLDAASKTLAMIPCGQPILVGHHSEKKHRRDIARIDANMHKGVAAIEESKRLATAADRAEASTTISSDDPDALDKLREKLAGLEVDHARMVKGNAAIRKALNDPAAIRELVVLGFDERAVTVAMTHYFGSRPYGFNVTGSSAEIRRVKARIAEIEARATAPVKEPERFGEVTIEESDNRVRIVFPAKPGDAQRTKLKAHGFRWSPSAGAWQRHASSDAWYWARKIAGSAS